MAKAGVGYMTEKLKVKSPKVMVVSIESAGGVEYAQFIADAVKKYGGTSSLVTMKITAADVTPQVLEIIKQKPDFITIYGVGNTSILTMKAMQQYGLKIPAFGISYLLSPQIYAAIGPDAGANYNVISCFTPGGADQSAGNREMMAAADKYNHSAMKEECDRYFTIPHRGEMRGVGGIFFDHMMTQPEESFAFLRDASQAFIPAYLPIARRRDNTPFEPHHRQWQLLRRGRYVEFNLVNDRGTQFGLRTGGRIESILMSMPANASWAYDHHPAPGSDEARMVAALQPRDWTI
jgi:hypothetical protein